MAYVNELPFVNWLVKIILRKGTIIIYFLKIELIILLDSRVDGKTS
jgi:hypothetical protein